MPYTTMIFDMDGTILNTLEDLTDAVNAMRRQEGLEPLPISHVRQSVGNGVAVLMEKTLSGGAGLSPASAGHCLLPQLL